MMQRSQRVLMVAAVLSKLTNTPLNKRGVVKFGRTPAVLELWMSLMLHGGMISRKWMLSWRRIVPSSYSLYISSTGNFLLSPSSRCLLSTRSCGNRSIPITSFSDSQISSEQIDKFFESYLQSLIRESSMDHIWRTYTPLSPLSLTSNEYLELISESSRQHNLKLLHSLLSRTHYSSPAAAVIGVQNLAQLYAPLYHEHSAHPEISQSLAIHFSHWLMLMDKFSRPKQIITFLNCVFHTCFHSNIDSFMVLYQNLYTQVFSLNLCETIECEEKGENLISVFILTTVQFLSDINQSTLAATLLQEAVAEGNLSSYRVDHSLYGSLVIRAVPRNLNFKGSKQWKTVQTHPGRGARFRKNTTVSTSNDSNQILDALFSIHAVGSTPADALLRDTFYKVYYILYTLFDLLFFRICWSVVGQRPLFTTKNFVESLDFSYYLLHTIES